MPSGFQFDRFDEDEDTPRRGGFFQRKRAQEPKVLFRVDHSLPFEDEEEDYEPQGFEEEAQEQREPSRQGRKGARRFSILSAAVILAAFGGFIIYSYLGDGDTQEQLAALPVLRADIESGKQRPEDPGGMEVPYQDRVVLNELEDDLEGGRVERLLPPPESPSLAAEVEGSEEATASSSAQDAESIKDLLARDDVAAAGASSEGGQAITPAVEEAADSVPAEEQVATMAIKETQEAAVTAGQAEEDTFVVQLASVKEKGRIEVEWRKLQEKHPDLLGKENYLIQEVKIENQGTFYRLQTGQFKNRGDADGLCANLKARSQPCIVVKR
jgi:hypothetical protein